MEASEVQRRILAHPLPALREAEAWRSRTLGASGPRPGIHEAEDVLKVLLAGADVAMRASALLQHGREHRARVRRGVADAFERANYMQTLHSWAGPQPAAGGARTSR